MSTWAHEMWVVGTEMYYKCKISTRFWRHTKEYVKYLTDIFTLIICWKNYTFVILEKITYIIKLILPSFKKDFNVATRI